MSRPRVAVVGTGLTALVAARHLEEDTEVVLVRPASVEADGPDGAVPGGVGSDGPLGLPAAVDEDARRIATDLLAGLGANGPARWWRPTGPVQVWLDERRRVVPPGLGTGTPMPLAATATSRVLSPAGLATLAAASLRPRRHVPGDATVAALVDARFGVEVRDRLVAPWVAAATGGDVTELSAACELPGMWDARAGAPVTARGDRGGAPGPARGVLTVPDGWAALVASLRSSLAARIDDDPVLAVGFDAHGPVLQQAAGVQPVDVVVLAVAVPDAVRLLHAAAPGVARELVGIAHRQLVEVVLDHEAAAMSPSAAVGTLLVPPSQGRRVVWVDRWPGDGPAPEPGSVRSRLLVPGGMVALADVDRRVREARGHLGGAAPVHGDDGALVRRVDAELRRCLGITRPAVRSWSTSWVIPQRTIGHLSRLDRLVHQLDQVPPGLHLGGAALRGVGPAARLHDAGRLAHEVRWQLSNRPRRPSVAAPTAVAVEDRRPR